MSYLAVRVCIHIHTTVTATATITANDVCDVGHILPCQGWNNGDVRWYSDIEDDSRIERAGTYVSKSKAWVRIKSSVCYWPSIVYIRRPSNKKGEAALKEDERVFIEPFGEGRLFLRPYINGMWIKTSQVSPFDVNNERRRRSGLQFKNKPISELFEYAMMMCNRSDIPALHFDFDGSFDHSHVKKLNGSSGSMSSSINKPKICPDVASMFTPLYHPSQSMIRDINTALQSMRSAANMDRKRKRIAGKHAEVQQRDIDNGKKQCQLHKEVKMRDLAEVFMSVATTSSTKSSSSSNARGTKSSHGSSSTGATRGPETKRRSGLPPTRIVIKTEK